MEAPGVWRKNGLRRADVGLRYLPCGEGACGACGAGGGGAGMEGPRVGPAQVTRRGPLSGRVGGCLASVEGVKEGDSDGQVCEEQTSSPF